MRIKTPWLLLGLAALAAGCAEPPTAAVDAAKQGLQALSGEAATYASDAYATAQDAVADLDAELATQEGTFALMRSYDRTNELVSAVEAATGRVRQAIDAERQRLRAEANGLVADAEGAVAEARQTIEGLPEEELEEGQVAAWEADLNGVSASLEETAGLLAGNQEAEAQRAAEAAAQAASGVSGAVAAVATAIEEARQAAVERALRGEVDIPRSVLLDGQALDAGIYSLRLAEEEPAPAGADAAGAGRWVEFVSDDDVAGKGLAIVIPDAEIGEVADTAPPRNEARVDDLKEAEYLRVWLNRDGVSYLLHLPRP